MHKIAGVYEIMCTKANRRYIGQSENIYKRYKAHLNLLKNNCHPNSELQLDYNLYGSDGFLINILEECEDKQYRVERETEWMNHYGGINTDAIYNQQDISGLSNKLRHKISDSSIGKCLSENHKKAISNGLKTYYSSNKSKLLGTHLTDMHKQKIRVAARNNPNYGLRGKTFTKEHRRHLSESKIRSGRYKGDKNPNYGNRKYSEEFIYILSCEYEKCHNYSEISKKYNLHYDTVRNLIIYGLPNPPDKYKYI